MPCMIEFPLTNEGAKVKKFLTDFIYHLRIRTAWRNTGMTL